ncbi:translation initiation factor 2 [Phosphitispora fastidiosa]|uniref:translation initiation factor 2 n=1 Tax=Phosphitispora fastidiosa TaxID=2837202 RepID=UPI001E3DD270|nr:translation initiation factor 2 [Phosphitispora fastidiosa]MBU7005243.1 serine phosphatase RsbU (regulator of sigma subunit) [Phosphitispora fastidiosa]
MGNDRSKLLEDRIRELEGKIEHLRFSRRVLMNLIERIEKDKCDILTKLEKENRKLQKNNSRYAQTLLNKNRQIIEMETKLQIMIKSYPQIYPHRVNNCE